MYAITAEQLIKDLKNHKYGYKNEKNCLPLRALKVTGLTYELFKSMLGAICNNYNDLSEIITKLDVSGNALQKLPKAIGILTKLQMLNVSHNQLQEIPEFNDCLPELEGFDGSHNRLQTLPMGIYDLPKLRSLNVENNPLDANTLKNIQDWEARLQQAEQKTCLETRSIPGSLAMLDCNADRREPMPSMEFNGLCFSKKYPAESKVQNADAKLTPETAKQRRDSDSNGDNLEDFSSDTPAARLRIASSGS